MERLSPQATYQAEKEKAERERRLSHAELMAEAQAEFDKMLADARSARKSGRPRKNPLPPPKVRRIGLKRASVSVPEVAPPPPSPTPQPVPP